MSSRHKDRTWKTSNTLRKLNFSTVNGDVGATIRSLMDVFKTLGTGNMYKLIAVPEGMYDEAYDMLVTYDGYSHEEAQKQARTDSLNEWVAVNTVDFYNETQLLYSLVAQFHKENWPNPKQGFPDGYNYRFPERKDVTTGHEYVTAVFIWIEDLLENPEIFPESSADAFPVNFMDSYMRKVYTRLCRVYACIFGRCIPSLKEIDAVKHLNTSWKHFYYFVKRFDLVDEKEFKPLKSGSLKGVISWPKLESDYAKDKQASGKQN